MKRIFFLLMVGLFFLSERTLAQQNQTKPSKFFVTTGYGLAGSFFVRSYEEPPNDFIGYKEYFKKKFVGSGQNLLLGFHLKNNFDLSFGLTYQHFTRHIKTKENLSGVLIILDHTIHHRDNIWTGGLNKNFIRKNNHLSVGIGLYYLRPKQEEIEINQPNFFMNQERNFKNSNLEEGGVFTEFAYEYKFQPKVNIGIKTQAYYTASASYFESVTLLPYIKLNF